MSHKLSKEIDFKAISKSTFVELLDTMVALDTKRGNSEYIQEGRDGFLDLYNYWVNDSMTNIETKILRNKANLND